MCMIRSLFGAYECVCDSRPAVKPAFPAVGYVCVCACVWS